MNATIQKWGNSLALRIPRAVARDTQLQNGSVVNLAVRKGTVVIEPVKKSKYRLDELLKGVSKHPAGRPPGSREFSSASPPQSQLLFE